MGSNLLLLHICSLVAPPERRRVLDLEPDTCSTLCPLCNVCYPKLFVRQLAALVVKETCVTAQ